MPQPARQFERSAWPERFAQSAQQSARRFADCRRARNRVLALRRTAVIAAAIGIVLAGLVGLGRFMGVGPFAGHIPEARYSAESWNLTVVNRWHRIPDAYPEPDLTRLRNGEQVDSRIYPDLQRMFDAMRADGLNPEVSAGYRTRATQQRILDEKIEAYWSEGVPRAAARTKALETVAVPGTSEHELGLAVDVNAAGMNDAAANQKVYAWLAEHAAQYGFVLRYPDGGTAVTGVAYEPWHYRYVGVQAASAMCANDLTLEEYAGAM
ncbi:D-alanyl-D-alanine carboxypeptidase family protein [Bifidobacterium avesanii]|uniref:D-alanyl-D-alanine carboxypeptidase family protein n=1 Tax=Bifidobacterium avesanii TaxID=1798157 RepID=A0A7K3TKZ0_9BIFI|nr:D-alanyl-D-alanine carboxypeptidase family protein [Bifidobacterium avesanii]